MVLAVHIAILHSEAHVGDLIDTLDVMSDTDRTAIEGTFGLLVDNESSLDWVCHESVLAPDSTLNARYAHRAETPWLAWVLPSDARDGHPLWVSTDLCEWEPATGIGERTVSSASFAPDGTAYVATADPELGNGVFRSTDSQAFVATEASSPDTFLSVDASGAAIWATSVNEDEALVWRSVDGLSFAASALPDISGFTPPVRARIGATHPTDPNRVWVILDPVGTDVLLRSTDGGQTFETVWEAPDRVTDLVFVPEDESLVAILNDRRPYRSADGTSFAELLDIPDASGVDTAPTGLVFSNRAFVNDLLVTTTNADGSQPQSVAPTAITAPLSCPAGSDGAVFCDPLWPGLEARLQPVVDTGTPSSSTPPPEETGSELIPQPKCSCATTPAGAAGTWLFLAGWIGMHILRRRDRLGAR